MRDGLQASLLRREIFPLFTVSAARNMGTGRVLGFIGNVLPHPGLIEAELESGEAFEINADSAPSLFCFKTVYEDHVGEVSLDRKSTRLNSSHVAMSYAVFGLKKIRILVRFKA